ncbi:MAG TPA: hypothetical protein VGR69_02975 [Candidatus Rubrimentiphilum sp.]|nr:hypothetical protein [Candidatus Rubrimentiphilum sp.]
MRVFRTIVACGLTLAFITACGGSTTTTTTSSGAASATAGAAMPGKAMVKKGAMKGGTTLSIKMTGQNGSKQNGTATLSDKAGGGVVVVVSLTNEPKGASEPAHIHQGTCAKLNPAPWKFLTNIVGGKSTTTVPAVTVAMLKKGTYAINAHKSASQLKVYVSCGNIK